MKAVCKKVQILCVAWLMALLCGCSATELEDRCFPMMAAVDVTDGQISFRYGFPELSQKDNTDVEEAKVNAGTTTGETLSECVDACNGRLEKLADCNHMKVLVLGEQLMQDKAQYEACLTYLKETELFPRNTYVCVTKDPQALVETEDALPEDLGSYLEEFLQNHESDWQIRQFHLGKLLDEQENQMLGVVLPYIAVQDGVITWTKNYE